MKTFYFNTGVQVYKMEHADKGQPKYYASTDVISPNGVRLIPFDCEDVPENATFKFCAPSPDLYPEAGYIVRKMHNTTMPSEYAYFTK